jgi:hypothetical protein
MEEFVARWAERVEEDALRPEPVTPPAIRAACRRLADAVRTGRLYTDPSSERDLRLMAAWLANNV